ncbi:transcriptional regulator [Acidovorax sp. Root275]|uniref:helix-turn-helix domain-containing protein n=1 Tax=unclassified Acidovorax TaxID=2684926 RepID=UPI0006FF90A9|nr:MULTISPECIES: helix-turn-helix transcriptional regulator [unclassified Acidovorax]KQW32808.1 transcriptional regulator [Acidovorax sp. Root402]KRD46706.1 transcriptional regulator [Acidovorax sp. Root275]
MNTFSNAFRAEVVRMARKELKPELQGMRKAITGHRSEIAALKREVNALTSQLKATQRQVKTTDAPKAKAATGGVTTKKSKQIPFDAQVLIDKRAALGITQKQMAQLLGASSISVYKWETGHVHPRAAQLERIAEVLKLGKRKALALLHPQ